MIRLQSLIKQTKNSSDFVGIISSSICAVHCIATPMLIAIGANFLSSSWLKFVFVIIAFLAIYRATIHSPFLKISLMLWVSFWIFLFSLFLEKTYPMLEYSGLIASAGIVTGHVMNIRY